MNAKKNKALNQTLTAPAASSGGVNVPSSNLDAFSERMRQLVKAVGSVAEIARKCGFPESTVKNWADGGADPSRERCVLLARGTGASVLWLVTGEGPMWAADIAQAASPEQSQGLRRDDLTMALQLAAEALEGKSLPPPKHAELVTLIYELLEEGLPEAKVLRFARAAGS